MADGVRIYYEDHGDPNAFPLILIHGWGVSSALWSEQTPFLVENGMVYISVNNGTEAFVYEVDPENATATKGATLIGNQFQGLFAN